MSFWWLKLLKSFAWGTLVFTSRFLWWKQTCQWDYILLFMMIFHLAFQLYCSYSAFTGIMSLKSHINPPLLVTFFPYFTNKQEIAMGGNVWVKFRKIKCLMLCLQISMGVGEIKVNQHPTFFYPFFFLIFLSFLSLKLPSKGTMLVSQDGNSSLGSTTEGWLVSDKSLMHSGHHCYDKIKFILYGKTRKIKTYHFSLPIWASLLPFMVHLH